MNLPRLLAASAALAFAAICATVPAVAQEPPQPTERGSFAGTWARVEPGQRQALQVRQADDGRWELRLYWWTSEDFLVDTGWQESSSFSWRGYDGTLTIAIDQQRSGPARIVGRWERDQDGTRQSHLHEEGPISLYRAGDRGQKIAFVIEPLVTRVEVGEPIAPYEGDVQERRTRRVWIMRRVSRLLIDWDEIPW